MFGQASGFPAEFELASLADGDGSNGFVLNGIDAYDFSGREVSGAGDVNGDGVDDLIIGAWRADPGGRIDAGESYVVFGQASGFLPEIDLSSVVAGDGGTGFVLNGVDALDRSGYSVSAAGDMNGDGVGDVIVGASYSDPSGQDSGGRSYVVFGQASGAPAEVELASLAAGDGSTGFVLNGIDANDLSGFSVSAAGDINGDGKDDVIVSAPLGDPGGRSSAGESYVVFGRTFGFPAEFELSSLAASDGSTGFVLNGVDADDFSGRSVRAAGDVNGDGVDDLIVGARTADPGGRSSAGETYVVFGRAADTDGDDIPDFKDNCTEIANADQRDTNADGFGNVCDADLNGDCAVNFADLTLLKSVFFTADVDADLDGSGEVNFFDLGMMKSGFFLAPGPSGVANACDDP